ncbi:MAG: tandem-95 repeat protein, partial [Pirellulales bacterium]|nr:tandem-95 repeat protein [Pirellulales bacterium]
NLVFTPSNPQNGTYTFTDGHTVEFTPHDNFNGTASFDFTVTDDGDPAMSGNDAITLGPLTFTINVLPVNDPPTTTIPDQTIDEDTSLVIDLMDDATDVETPGNLTFDIVGQENGTATLDGTVLTFEPYPNFNGTATFTFTITDGGDNGADPVTSDPVTVTVTVNPINDAPVAVDDSRTVSNNRSTTINILSNDTDVDLGDTLSIESFDSTGSHNGTLVDAGDGKSLIYTPVDLWGQEGTETFSYTVRDAAGATDTILITLTLVPNEPPVAGDDADETDEDTVLIGSGLLDNDTDPDTGDVLSTIVFNGTSTEGAIVTIDDAGNYTYDPTGVAAMQSLAVNESMTDTFEYTVDDGNGGQDVGTVTITVHGVNDAPTAVDQTGATDEDTAINGNVLSGATDPDASDTLGAVVFDGYSTLGAVVTIDAAGNFIYNPAGAISLQTLADGQSTDDTFSFTIDDGHGGQDTRTVTITVSGVNDAPVANDDAYVTNEDVVLLRSVAQGVLSNDGDIDSGDSISVVAFDSASTQGATVSVNEDGSFTYNPTGAAALQALPVGQNLQDTFTYTIEDGLGVQSTTTVTITVNGVNDAPTAQDQTADADANAAFSGSGLLNGAADVDKGDTVTVSVAASDSTSQAGAAVTVTTVGTYVYDPTGVAAFLALGQNETMTDTFTFVVVDSHGAPGTATVTVTVHGINNAPVAGDDAFTTGENTILVADVSRNLLDGDTDPDTNDTLTVQEYSGTSGLGAAVTVNTDGTFSYDPGTLFDYLSVGQQVQDTFNYLVVDFHDLTDQGTVTITIQGANDAPNGENDSATTDKLTAIDITVLGNDTDPDQADTLDVGTFDATSNEGATIQLNLDGTFHYDPTTSSSLQALGTGQHIIDTFTYTVVDDHGGEDVVTVSVTVNGQSNTPYVANPIADFSVTDSSDPNTTDFDLNHVFKDLEGDTLLFEVTNNSNPDLVQVSIDGGTLHVTYIDYTSGQDRTPATIEVKATENTAQQLFVTDEFVVTVLPEYLINVELIVRDTPTPSGETTKDESELPASIDQVQVGSQYVVEIWIQDAYDATVSGGPSHGLNGAQFDFFFDPALSQAVNGGLGHDGPFSTLPGGTIDNVTGVVNNFGGGNIDQSVALAPNYSRVGYITIDASAGGTQVFDVTPDLIARAISTGVGPEVDLTQVFVEPVSVDQVQEVLTFDISSTTSVYVTGQLFGQPLTAQVSSSDYGVSPFGSLQVIVDDLDNPSQLNIVSGTLDFEVNMPDPLRPGEYGSDGSAYADLAFNDVNSQDIEMAIRDLIFDLSTNGFVTVTSGASKFDASLLNITVDTGHADIRRPAGSGRYEMADLIAASPGSETGTLLPRGNIYELECVSSRTIDLSGLIGGNSYLSLVMTITAEYDPTGSGLMGTESVPTEEAGTLVHATLSHDPTLVPTGTQVDTLPTSEAWIDEWDSFWVELWVRTTESTGVQAAMLDLSYNPDYFTATAINHGHTFVDDASGDLSQDGLVEGLGGSTTLDGFGAGAYTLLGRVRFESLAGDNVALGDGLGPHDLGLSLDNLDIQLVGAGTADASVGQMPETELWAVPYDADDNGQVNLIDLSYFASAYGQDVLEVDTTNTWAADYDRTGLVNLIDLSYFAANYGKAKAQDAEVVFPEAFLRRWVGAGLEIEGDATVGQLLDTAVETWQDELGLAQPIDIQLVVKDFGTAQLGEAQILEVDQNGVPIRGRVTLDDDAAGLGWSSQLDTLGSQDKYDLYTVLLHEIGHTLGFMDGYDGFAVHVQTDTDQVNHFVAAGIDVTLDAAAEHLAGEALAGDLMSPTLQPGVRKLPSHLDVQILHAAYQSASGGANGFASLGAAMYGEGASLGAVHTTADHIALERLEGDVTWDRLLANTATSPLGLIGARNDLVDAVYTQQRPSRVDDDQTWALQASDLFWSESDSDSLLPELTTDAEHEGDASSIDAVLAGWEDLSTDNNLDA